MSHFAPAHRRGFAQQANKQGGRANGGRGDGESDKRRGVSGRLDGKKAWRRPLSSAENGARKPELVLDSPKVVFANPIPAPKPLPPTSLRIVSGRIKRSVEQQANHDAQRLPDDVLVRVADFIEAGFARRGVDVVSLRTIQALSGASPSLRYLIGGEDDWARRLARFGIGASSFKIVRSHADVEGRHAGRALGSIRQPPIPSVVVSHICRHGPGPYLSTVIGADCPACLIAMKRTRPCTRIYTPDEVKRAGLRLKLSHAHAQLFPLGGPDDPVFFDTPATLRLRAALKADAMTASKTRWCASDKLADHPAVVHAFATEPPVSSLTITRIQGWDDRLEDYETDANGCEIMTGAAVTVDNPYGVTIFDVFCAWFEALSKAEFELRDQLEEARVLILCWQPFRAGSCLLVPLVEAAPNDEDDYLDFL